MESAITIENLKEELADVMSCRALQGLTVAQALEVARVEYASRLRHFQMWAVDRKSERAYQAARAAFRTIEYVVAVLEAALAPEPVAQAVAVAAVAPQSAVARPIAASRRMSQPCPFYRAIRRCYAIFEEKGLPVDDDAMRAVLAELLGRAVPSRKTLSGSDWMNAGTLAKQLVAVG